MSDTDPITRVNAALVGRYRIDRELGEGGVSAAGSRLFILGLMAWLVAWILPAYGDAGLSYGWQAFLLALPQTEVLLTPWTLLVEEGAAGLFQLGLGLSPLTNLIMLVCLVVLRRSWPQRPSPWAARILVCCALVNGLWFADAHWNPVGLINDPKALLTGYWAWFGGMVLLAIGAMTINAQTTRHAEDGDRRVSSDRRRHTWSPGIRALAVSWSVVLLLMGFGLHGPRVDRLSAIGTEVRVGAPSSATTTPIRVSVSDQYGGAVEGVLVTFRVLNGDGTVSGRARFTDQEGWAGPDNWILGPEAGENVLEASTDNLPSIRFMAMALDSATLMRRADSITANTSRTLGGTAYSRADPELVYGSRPGRVRFQITSRTSAPDPLVPGRAVPWSPGQIGDESSNSHLATQGYRRLELWEDAAFNLKMSFLDSNSWGGIQIRRTGQSDLAIRSRSGRRWEVLQEHDDKSWSWSPYGEQRRFFIYVRNGGRKRTDPSVVLVEYRFLIATSR